MPSTHPNSPAATAAGGLAAALAKVACLSADELRAHFRRLYRMSPPPALSRDLLARLIAQRLQEHPLGRLDPEFGRQLDRIGRGEAPVRRLKPGSVVVREYEGILHEVTVVPGGFRWNEAIYPSLSTIARLITGTSWSGPRFFGLRNKVSSIEEAT
ncbi:MAG: DUF2924 domain-containing protein [Bosea sp.]|uniref:DUF2924 domain-containing protein n=1 Tax=Bosea sp. (in: a-proteobacteria) TaxID=1871050 RepID=UPI0023903A5F|nr:DUF2924 domain-containing protein [Bosea sp. (in: a-proteobacteria)]MCP4733816.1 DUF2924 domain-containing protein [Bosea sp. (in: a-proteobacteria)]